MRRGVVGEEEEGKEFRTLFRSFSRIKKIGQKKRDSTAERLIILDFL